MNNIIKHLLTGIFTLLSFTEVSVADWSRNDLGYSLSVDGVTHTFLYHEDSSYSGWGNVLCKHWGWTTGQGWESEAWWESGAFRKSTTENMGGFPEYVAEGYASMGKVRRPPPLPLTIAPETVSFLFNGDFFSLGDYIPSADFYMTQNYNGFGITGPPSWQVVVDEFNRIGGDGQLWATIMKPALIVQAQDGSWGWKSPLESVGFSPGQLASGGMQRAYPGNTYVQSIGRIPDADRWYHLDCSVPIPEGWSGGVNVWITGFVMEWYSQNRSQSGSGLGGLRGMNIRYYRYDCGGTGMPFSYLYNGSITSTVRKKPVLKGSIMTATSALSGYSGPVSTNFSLWTE